MTKIKKLPRVEGAYFIGQHNQEKFKGRIGILPNGYILYQDALRSSFCGAREDRYNQEFAYHISKEDWGKHEELFKLKIVTKKMYDALKPKSPIIFGYKTTKRAGKILFGCGDVKVSIRDIKSLTENFPKYLKETQVINENIIKLKESIKRQSEELRILTNKKAEIRTGIVKKHPGMERAIQAAVSRGFREEWINVEKLKRIIS